MKFYAIAPEYDDANIPENLAPPMYPNIDWLHNQKNQKNLLTGLVHVLTNIGK